MNYCMVLVISEIWMTFNHKRFKIQFVTVVAGLKIHVKNYSIYLAGEYPMGRLEWVAGNS